MEQYLLYILLLCVGIIIGGILYKYSMTTPEQRELDKKHSVEHALTIKRHIENLNKIDEKYNQLKIKVRNLKV